MNIRNATIHDLPHIERIYEYARETMRKNGNASQWINGYPHRDVLQDDIDRGCLYVVLGHDENIHGVFYFAIEEDPTYAIIEHGTWLNDEPYGVIHRIASDGTMRGIFPAALSFAKARTNNVRIDTHDHNAIMQHVLERDGFQRCGIIYCHDGTPRIAYHYVAQYQASKQAPR